MSIETEKYGFQGRLSEPFPSQIIVDATDICNLECRHCPHPTFKKGPHYRGVRMDAALNEKMVKEVRDYGRGHTEYIRYTSNGEPLSHPEIFTMLRYAVENSGSTVCLTTNGTLLSGQRLSNLVDTGVHMIDISIDAFKDETYAKIRVKGVLERTRTNVLNLIKEKQKRNPKLKIVVSFIEQPDNVTEIADFERFWKENGADYVVIRKLHTASGALGNSIASATPTPERYPCLYPWERITLNPEGFLAYCPTDWQHGSVIADYRQITIHELWQSEIYKTLRKEHLCNRFEKFSFCEQCPDWQLTRWPSMGRSYADMVTELVEEN